MPSPVGHGLAALAVGWLAGGVRQGDDGAPPWRTLLWLVLLGMAPDLDLLWGRHSRETHSVGAALIVATVAAWQRWPLGASRWRIWLAAFLAWLSHPILDALALDTAPPLGVMVFWPWSVEHVQTGWSVFGPISRRPWLWSFWTTNVTSLARELLILGPIVLGVATWRRYRNPDRTSGRGARQPPSA